MIWFASGGGRKCGFLGYGGGREGGGDGGCELLGLRLCLGYKRRLRLAFISLRAVGFEWRDFPFLRHSNPPFALRICRPSV